MTCIFWKLASRWFGNRLGEWFGERLRKCVSKSLRKSREKKCGSTWLNFLLNAYFAVSPCTLDSSCLYSIVFNMVARIEAKYGFCKYSFSMFHHFIILKLDLCKNVLQTLEERLHKVHWETISNFSGKAIFIFKALHTRSLPCMFFYFQLWNGDRGRWAVGHIGVGIVLSDFMFQLCISNSSPNTSIFNS